MMKNILVVLFIAFAISDSAAQKVTVENTSMKMDDGYNSAFAVFIPHASTKTVEKKWVGFLKDNNARVKSNKDGISGQNAMINAIGPDTLQIFSKIEEAPGGVLLTSAFRKEGTYIAPATFAGDAKLLERILNDFATPIAKNELDNKISIATKLLSVKMVQLQNLQKKDERLVSDIEKMKVKIAENEREQKEIKEQQTGLNKDIDEQKTNLETIKNMGKDLK